MTVARAMRDDEPLMIARAYFEETPGSNLSPEGPSRIIDETAEKAADNLRTSRGETARASSLTDEGRECWTRLGYPGTPTSVFMEGYINGRLASLRAVGEEQ